MCAWSVSVNLQHQKYLSQTTDPSPSPHHLHQGGGAFLEEQSWHIADNRKFDMSPWQFRIESPCRGYEWAGKVSGYIIFTIAWMKFIRCSVVCRGVVRMFLRTILYFISLLLPCRCLSIRSSFCVILGGVHRMACCFYSAVDKQYIWDTYQLTCSIRSLEDMGNFLRRIPGQTWLHKHRQTDRSSHYTYALKYDHSTPLQYCLRHFPQ